MALLAGHLVHHVNFTEQNSGHVYVATITTVVAHHRQNNFRDQCQIPQSFQVFGRGVSDHRISVFQSLYHNHQVSSKCDARIWPIVVG